VFSSCGHVGLGQVVKEMIPIGIERFSDMILNLSDVSLRKLYRL
jgi:hypothetical protein